MEVNFTPEQEEQLLQVAAAQGTDAEEFVRSAALYLLEDGAKKPTGQTQSLVEKMRALRERVKPDPEGWTTLDYVHFGRR